MQKNHNDFRKQKGENNEKLRKRKRTIARRFKDRIGYLPGKDCYGALVWFYEHAHELHVNPEKIAVAGSSGGGGLTLSIALRARDCQYPPIAYLMPLTPMISRNLKTESAKGDFNGLPAVYTFAGELDPFRDETILLAQKLMACHVPVELHIFPGCCHVFDALVPNAPISRYAVSEMIRALQDNLATN